MALVCHPAVVGGLFGMSRQSDIGYHSLYRETSDGFGGEPQHKSMALFCHAGAIVKLSGSDEKAWLPLEPRLCPTCDSLVCPGIPGSCANQSDDEDEDEAGVANGQEEHVAGAHAGAGAVGGSGAAAVVLYC